MVNSLPTFSMVYIDRPKTTAFRGKSENMAPLATFPTKLKILKVKKIAFTVRLSKSQLNTQHTPKHSHDDQSIGIVFPLLHLSFAQHPIELHRPKLQNDCKWPQYSGKSQQNSWLVSICPVCMIDWYWVEGANTRANPQVSPYWMVPPCWMVNSKLSCPCLQCKCNKWHSSRPSQAMMHWKLQCQPLGDWIYDIFAQLTNKFPWIRCNHLNSV